MTLITRWERPNRRGRASPSLPSRAVVHRSLPLACVPHLRARPGTGIVFVGSTAGQRGEAFHSHYAATKGGLISFTRSLAVELAPVRVNLVAPGWIRTDMSEESLRPENVAGALK
ncbi:MAG: SDR family oxidoreductase, partial [Syntrophobacteraceae bacterium]|nr:SDR family oxidoreductase [Syntrophobacteraceae bacterium]